MDFVLDIQEIESGVGLMIKSMVPFLMESNVTIDILNASNDMLDSYDEYKYNRKLIKYLKLKIEHK